MVNLLAGNLPLLVLLSHFALAFFLLALLAREREGRTIMKLAGENSLLLSWLFSIATLLGSLLYSWGVGFEPCVLCWWQRIFLFPLVIIFGLAWWRGDRKVFRYTTPLVVLAGVISLYQTYTNLGGTSLLECTGSEGACAKLYVYEYGYITIPTMALTSVAYLLLLTFINRWYENRYS